MNPGKFPMLTIACFFSYFLFGFVDNMKGSTLPVILDEMDFSYVDGANIVLGEYIGFVLATLLTGVLSDILGKRAVLFIAGAFLFVGSIGYGMSASFTASMLFLAVIGMGCGSVELGGSGIVSEIHIADKARHLNLLSCFHGVGSMLVPQFVGLMVFAGHGWRASYMMNAALAVLCVLMFLMAAKEPRGVDAFAREKGAPFTVRMFTTRIMLLNFIMFCYVAAEIAVSTWLVDFLIKEKGLSFSWASVFLSVYFAAIMIGRFSGSFIVDKIGHARIIFLCSTGAIGTLLCGIFLSSFLVILLPLTGALYAVIFPTTTAIVSNEAKHHHGAFLGILFCCGGIGGMLGPWLTGILNDSFGLAYGMGINAVFCLGIAIASMRLLRI